MAKRPRTTPMVNCPDVAGILNKFAEPMFWCQPQRGLRKNRLGKESDSTTYWTTMCRWF